MIRDINDILEDFKEKLFEIIQSTLYKDLIYAKIDVNRKIRRGFPEVIFAKGKSAEQIREIVLEFLKHEKSIMITHANKEIYEKLKDLEDVKFHSDARIITIGREEIDKKGVVAVITGGTSDIPVAEEAAITAEFFGSSVTRIYDVGVAGIHRLFDKLDEIRKADVVIVCAGMDGALFSIVAGLVGSLVIAVPTSVGYGANFNGVAPLFTALNSCVPGLVVFNIDNGFGAGYFAALLIRKIYK